MKDLIKVLIALVFIAGAFVTGKHMASETCSAELIEIESKLQQEKVYTIQIRDSLNQFKNELDNYNSLQIGDTIETLKPGMD